MATANVFLEGIAHEESFDIPLGDWRRLLELARSYGWKPTKAPLWDHYYSPIGEPEPMPPRDARRMADALEGALVRRCSHDQFPRDPETPAPLLAWCATPEGKQTLRAASAFLRKGGISVASAGS